MAFVPADELDEVRKALARTRIRDLRSPLEFLVGSYVTVEAEVVTVVNSNPYTRSQRPERQRRYVVRGTISTYYVDHLWVWGFNRNYHWHVGKRVKFKGPLRKYLYDGVYKYKIGTPLRLLKF
jgi:NAD(P)H-flavin reductase